LWGAVRELDLDGVSGADDSFGQDDAHDPGLADQVADLVAADDLLELGGILGDAGAVLDGHTSVGIACEAK
jgi:hypothetical protein